MQALNTTELSNESAGACKGTAKKVGTQHRTHLTLAAEGSDCQRMDCSITRRDELERAAQSSAHEIVETLALVYLTCLGRYILAAANRACSCVTAVAALLLEAGKATMFMFSWQ